MRMKKDSMTSRLVAYLLSVVIGLGMLTGQLPATAATTSPPPRWQVVLAAGDDTEPVFDNATRALGQRLAAAGVPAANIHRLSASAAELGTTVEPAFADVLLKRISTLPARSGDRCLIFLTSHGEHNAGLWLARSNAALYPLSLPEARRRGRVRWAPVVDRRTGNSG